ncbi:hypothetical protein LPJ78_004154 [Coemansia sp. RSA 989]|nr:hypothetical protein LPJ78_004154 [Coemansia sp. RSA 989]
MSINITHVYSKQLLDTHAVSPWKLQMTAASSQQDLLFVAQGRHVLVFRIRHHACLPMLVTRLAYPRLHVPEDDINAITLERYYDKETLVAVYDSGLTVACNGNELNFGTRARSPISLPLIEIETNRENDVQNGYTDSAATPDPEAIGSSGPQPAETPSGFEPEGTHATLASPLLLCTTKRDLFLVDPANEDAPVVDSVENVANRTAFPTPVELMLFDRVAFLEWIPEMAIAITGSLSGTVTIVCIYTEPDSKRPQHRMHVLAQLPDHAPSQPLYGIALYRHPDNEAGAITITLYALYIDGQLMAYDISCL